ncbi:hypothetical protein EMCG_00296 [[Emmonsia] crescens]|uniref:Uncharacterized protein n=1 Tax=[Emmonsia] crescens TaxID=73230 RepID=A0A0G2HYV9_9EURO|nr:hypothetical protein EMCG_00296 [Emmonsia crescens UAMH 3008]
MEDEQVKGELVQKQRPFTLVFHQDGSILTQNRLGPVVTTKTSTKRIHAERLPKPIGSHWGGMSSNNSVVPLGIIDVHANITLICRSMEV